MFRLNNEACFVGLHKPTKGHMSLAKSALFPKKREIPIIRYKPSKKHCFRLYRNFSNCKDTRYSHICQASL